MSIRVYVVAVVPAAARESAEVAVAPLLQSPSAPGTYTFSVPLVPLAGADDATATHYGCCAPFLHDYLSALPTLAAAIPGTAYKVISPWRTFDHAADWTGWLAMQSLKPQVLPMGEG